jgi:hypothetical protein
MHGGAAAHQLGTSPEDNSAPARWSVDLRTAAGRSQVSSVFSGVRRD